MSKRRGFRSDNVRPYVPHQDDGELQWLEHGIDAVASLAFRGILGIVAGICSIVVGLLTLPFSSGREQ